MMDDYKFELFLSKLELATKAMRGDKEAARMYCGSYTLVTDRNGNLFRCSDEIPSEFTKVLKIDNKYPYDENGFLLPEFWILPRINEF